MKINFPSSEKLGRRSRRLTTSKKKPEWILLVFPPILHLPLKLFEANETLYEVWFTFGGNVDKSCLSKAFRGTFAVFVVQRPIFERFQTIFFTIHFEFTFLLCLFHNGCHILKGDVRTLLQTTTFRHLLATHSCSRVDNMSTGQLVKCQLVFPTQSNLR